MASEMDRFLISIKGLQAKLEFMPDLGLLKENPRAGVAPATSWPIEKKGRC